jgi:hypothetical protein
MMNERMARVETNIENIKEQIGEIKEMLTDHVNWESDKYEEMDKKFAPKWIEKFVIALIVGGGVTLFGVLISIIVK